ncbi:hypothetical protein D3C75_1300090 [compost metagenome]
MIRMGMGQEHRIRLNIFWLRYRRRIAANKGVDNQRLAAYLNLYTGMSVKKNLHSLSLPFNQLDLAVQWHELYVTMTGKPGV